MYLPRSHGKVERPATEDADQRLAAGEETILVVEDNEGVRAVAVLRKPYQIAALARVIRDALDSAKFGRPALAS